MCVCAEGGVALSLCGSQVQQVWHDRLTFDEDLSSLQHFDVPLASKILFAERRSVAIALAWKDQDVEPRWCVGGDVEINELKGGIDRCAEIVVARDE